jgi:acylphosphatase
MSELRRIRFVVTGRVQGVGFRAWTERTALAAGLTGWVANRSDGAVEGEAQGAARAVGSFVLQLQRGPLAARVVGVEVVEEDVVDGEVGFGVRRGG